MPFTFHVSDRLRFAGSHLAAATVVVAFLLAPLGAQTTEFYPLDALRPGMVAHGTTVFVGGTREPFEAHILGVLKNVIGPGRDLILARLEGGPLANTGVIAGMSGSPVFIDGKLVGAVSYSLGSFQKEPIAGITPIREMVDATAPSRAPQRASADAERLPLSPDGVIRAFAPPLERDHARGLGDRHLTR